MYLHVYGENQIHSYKYILVYIYNCIYIYIFININHLKALLLPGVAMA